MHVFVWSKCGQFPCPLFCHSHHHPHKRLESLRRSESGKLRGRAVEQRKRPRAERGTKKGDGQTQQGIDRNFECWMGLKKKWNTNETPVWVQTFFPLWNVLPVEDNRISKSIWKLLCWCCEAKHVPSLRVPSYKDGGGCKKWCWTHVITPTPTSNEGQA